MLVVVKTEELESWETEGVLVGAREMGFRLRHSSFVGLKNFQWDEGCQKLCSLNQQ
jgi:hypothetical protein